MNMQTVKPRARPVMYDIAGQTFTGWRVHHSSWGCGYVGSTLDGALRLAHRMRLFRLTKPR